MFFNVSDESTFPGRAFHGRNLVLRMTLSFLLLLLIVGGEAFADVRPVALRVQFDGNTLLELSAGEQSRNSEGADGQRYLSLFETVSEAGPVLPVSIVREEDRDYLRRIIHGKEYELTFVDGPERTDGTLIAAWDTRLATQPLVFGRGSKVGTRIGNRYYFLKVGDASADGSGSRAAVWDPGTGAEFIFQSADDEVTTRFTGNKVIDAGSPELAAAYYQRIKDDIGFSFENSTLDDFIAYMMYPDTNSGGASRISGRDLETMVSLSDFQRGPDFRPLPNPLPAGMTDASTLTSYKGRMLWDLQASDALKTATFFAPKIVNYARSHPYDAGWRKMVYIAAQAGSRAEKHRISGAYVLFNYAGNNQRDPANKDPLLEPDGQEHAISKNNQIILMPNFDTASGGRQHVPGKVDTAYFAVYGPYDKNDPASRELSCFNKVQGGVAWNQAGNTRWSSANVEWLCENTADPDATIACFEAQIADHGYWSKAINACRVPSLQEREQSCYSKVQGKVAWARAGHTNWQDGNVRKLCKNTEDPDATIACFNAEITRHDNWFVGLSNCRSEAQDIRKTSYVALDFLAAGFDIDDGAATLGKYHVPNACAHCHGHDQYDSGGVGEKRIFPYVKPNYIDTDNLYQAMRQDFRDLSAGVFSEPLLVNKRQGSAASQFDLPEFRARFAVLRSLNEQMSQEGEYARRTPVDEAMRLAREGKGNDLYQFGGVQSWLEQHGAHRGNRAYEPISLPTIRGYGFTMSGDNQRAWVRNDSDHVNLLNRMDQYCFRCHSTIKFSAFDLNSIGRNKESIISYVESGYMPPGRTVPKEDRDCIVGTLQSLFKSEDYRCLQP